jgi:hypothetical protein
MQRRVCGGRQARLADPPEKSYKKIPHAPEATMCAKEPPRPRAPMIDWGWVGRVGLRGWKILDRSLRETSKRTGGLTLLVSAIALCFVVAGYRLQKKSDRPMLAYTGSTGSRILQSETAISSNNGKQPGRGGVATLSIVHEDRQGPEKVTSAPIEPGADAQTFYRASASTTFKVEEQRIRGSSLLLVCTTYFDDAGAPYRQAFVLRPSLMPGVAFEEQSSPESIKTAERQCEAIGW